MLDNLQCLFLVIISGENVRFIRIKMRVEKFYIEKE